MLVGLALGRGVALWAGQEQRPDAAGAPRVLGSHQLLGPDGTVVKQLAPSVIAASGGTLYGEPQKLPVPESHPQRPLSPYGVAKKAAGDYLAAYRELHGIEFTALALANVYGPRQDPHGEAGVVAIFAGRLLAGEPCTIFGDGNQTRDFVYVDDVVDAFARAAHKGSGLLMNIGTGVETSVNELYATIARQAGSSLPAAFAPARSSSSSRRTRAW